MSTWRVGTTTAGFDGVWSQPSERIAVFKDNQVVKVYSVWWGDWLAKLLAHLYILRHK